MVAYWLILRVHFHYFIGKQVNDNIQVVSTKAVKKIKIVSPKWYSILVHLACLEIRKDMYVSPFSLAETLPNLLVGKFSLKMFDQTNFFHK